MDIGSLETSEVRGNGASAIGTKFARWSDTPCAASVRPPLEVHFRTGKFTF